MIKVQLLVSTNIVQISTPKTTDINTAMSGILVRVGRGGGGGGASYIFLCRGCTARTLMARPFRIKTKPKKHAFSYNFT